MGRLENEVVCFPETPCKVAGLLFAGVTSKGEAFTKPMSRRPREITSIIEYSSATRTASIRLAIGMPRQRSPIFLVSRARIAIGIADRGRTGRGRMVLVDHDVDAELVTQRPFVEIAVVEIGAEFRIVNATRNNVAEELLSLPNRVIGHLASAIPVPGSPYCVAHGPLVSTFTVSAVFSICG